MLSLADRPSLAEEPAWLGAEPLTGAAEGIVAGVVCQLRGEKVGGKGLRREQVSQRVRGCRPAAVGAMARVMAVTMGCLT